MSDVRRVRRQQHSLLNRLRSCASDADFVSEFHAGHLSGLTVFANLRQGQWYTPPDAMTCHFKSSDGHCGAWKFNPRRVNVHLVAEAIRGGGLIIVDSTRKGKRVPDSFSRTIPIWATVLNRIAQRYIAYLCRLLVWTSLTSRVGGLAGNSILACICTALFLNGRRSWSRITLRSSYLWSSTAAATCRFSTCSHGRFVAFGSTDLLYGQMFSIARSANVTWPLSVSVRQFLIRATELSVTCS